MNDKKRVYNKYHETTSEDDGIVSFPIESKRRKCLVKTPVVVCATCPYTKKEEEEEERKNKRRQLLERNVEVVCTIMNVVVPNIHDENIRLDVISNIGNSISLFTNRAAKTLVSHFSGNINNAQKLAMHKRAFIVAKSICTHLLLRREERSHVYRLAAESCDWNACEWIRKSSEWGMKNVSECKTSGMIGACASGNLEFIMYYVRNTRTTKKQARAHEDAAFVAACERGHLSVAMWFFDTYIQKDMPSISKGVSTAFARSCKANKMEIYTWLLEDSRSWNVIDVEAVRKAFVYLCSLGHTEYAHRLFEKDCVRLGDQNSHTYISAAIGASWFIWQGFKDACENGHIQTVQWLFSVFSRVFEDGIIITDALYSLIENIAQSNGDERQKDILFDIFKMILDSKKMLSINNVAHLIDVSIKRFCMRTLAALITAYPVLSSEVIPNSIFDSYVYGAFERHWDPFYSKILETFEISKEALIRSGVFSLLYMCDRQIGLCVANKYNIDIKEIETENVLKDITDQSTLVIQKRVV